MSESRQKYVLISPCRNEAEFMRETLESVLAQSVQPTHWVIVDDGSTDESAAIAAEYAARVPWISVVQRQDRGHRLVGPGVIDAFYAGLEAIELDDFEFVCKLDLDLCLPAQYFEILVDRMASEPRLGVCSGKAYFRGKHGQLISESCGDEMAVGMTKFYRVSCFRQIGGFVREVMWDGIDCHRCRMMGWIACSWDEPELQFVHLRPMGSSHQGLWTGRVRWGFGQYFMGTGLAYITASALFRMTRPPRFVGGLAIWWGYISSCIKRRPRYDDSEFRAFLRRYQWDCLIKGKARATALTNEARSHLWQSDSGGAGPL